MIVGLSGLARCGKDSFFNFSKTSLRKKGLSCRRLAFADELKNELDDFLVKNFSISCFTEKTEEKEIIRPIMVSYGMAKRQMTNGRYWLNKIENKIKNSSDKFDYNFITDVRFENEVKSIKDFGGVCIHITRDKNIAPNEEEKINDPIVKNSSDFNFYWENFKDIDEGKPENLVSAFLDKIL
jgi:hypothetical protein